MPKRLEPVRINIRYLANCVLLSLILPGALALVLDLSLGSMPLFTIGAALIFIPLSTVIVTRATLAELDRVIQLVAPLEADRQDSTILR